jgi:hypothetical protein
MHGPIQSRKMVPLTNSNRSTQTKPIITYRVKTYGIKTYCVKPIAVKPDRSKNLLLVKTYRHLIIFLHKPIRSKPATFQNLSLTVKTFHKLILLLPYSLSGQRLLLKKICHSQLKPATCESLALVETCCKNMWGGGPAG